MSSSLSETDLDMPDRSVADERFDRFRLISWWDQARLRNAKVLVIGAGALGNEIVKNLALLGIGHLFIADLDRIENSNLSRSVLYRASHNGLPKASVAAQGARDIYPEMRVQAFDGNAAYDLGLGVFRWADIVLAGLDNREARLMINRNCWKVNRPWIDGAIEQIRGTARVFVPDGPCYECTMSQADWKALQQRRSCNLLTRAQMQQERTPTTPTISSLIASVQCQETVKYLHGLPTLSGKAWVFDGMSTDAYQVELQRKPDCSSHERLAEIVSLPARSATVTVRELLNTAREILGPSAELELPRDILETLTCPACGVTTPVFASLGSIDAGVAACPECGLPSRQVNTFYKIRGGEPWLDRTASSIGLPPFDIVIARTLTRAIGLEFSGDARAVLGELSETEALEWL